MKIAVVYASMTGNTVEIGEILAGKVAETGHDVEKFHVEFDDIMALDLKNYDAVLFGTYTWGDADLPFELEDFHDDLEDEDLTGKVVGLFGSCDSYYEFYSAAMEIITKQCRAVGTNVKEPLMKIKLATEKENKEKMTAFVDKIIEKIS